jgi:hypothetical protein
MIEINAPALIKNNIEFALEDLEDGNIKTAKETLIEVRRVAIDLIDWLRMNAEMGAELPISWTEFIHMDNE